LSLSTIANKYCPSVCRPFLNRVQQSPIGKRIVGGMFWSIVGNGFGKVFTLIAMIFISRILGKEQFGEFGLIRSTAETFMMFGCLGLNITSTKYIAEFLHTDKEKIGRIISLNYLFTFGTSAVVATFFWYCIPYLCETKLNAPQLSCEMQWGTLLLFLIAFVIAQTGIMFGFQDFKGQALTTIVVGFLSIPVYCFGAMRGGLHGIIVSFVMVTTFNVIMNSYFIFRNMQKYKIKYLFRDAYKELPIIWKFNLPIMCSGIIYTGGMWFCQIMLRSQLNGKAELGIFFAAMTIGTILMYFSTNLRNVIFPILSEAVGQKNNRRFYKIVTIHLVVSTIVIITITLPVIVFAKWIMNGFGETFIDGYKTLRLLCFYAIAFTFVNTMDQVVLSQGRSMLNLTYVAIGTIVSCCIALYLFINGYGSEGLVIALIIGMLSRFIVVSGYSLWKLWMSAIHSH
jgi:O-antigen/teichoic acid export membrane protein